MELNEITITFRGICTNFLNTVPGIPLRVVLPDCLSFKIGGFVVPPDTRKIHQYVLPPHLPYVYSCSHDSGITAPGIWYGWIIAGVRLTIANAVDEGLTYLTPDPASSPTIPDVPHLKDYAHRYRYSADVVTGGRAMAYFDIFRGTVSSRQDGDAWHTIVTMKTSGLPRLQVTLLDNRGDVDTPPQVQDVFLGKDLTVGNTSFLAMDSKLDFLWHLTTDQNGIPAVLPQPPFGADLESGDTSKISLPFGDMLNQFRGQRPVTPDIMAADFNQMASCSNTQVP